MAWGKPLPPESHLAYLRPTMTDPLEILHSTFGYPAFRGRQAEVIARVMAGERTLADDPNDTREFRYERAV